MLNAWILVGAHGTRKSSVIRALTGVGQAGVYKIARSEGPAFQALILPKTIQEMNPKLQLEPERFVRWVKEHFSEQNFHDIVFTLREHGIGRGKFHRPGAEAYIEYLAHKAHWKIQPVICFNTHFRSKIVTSATVANTTRHANNEIASMIRTKWGWM